MDIYITINKKHATAFALFASLLLCVLLVRGFGGSNPSVMGHSALELIVNSSSVVDDSLTGADIDESTLVIGGSSLDGAVIIVTPGNETTIQNAIDNLSSLGGGTVYMREGTYTIAGPINMTSNIALVGEGLATILQATTNTIDIITDNSATYLHDVRLKDFALRAGSATGVDGVVFTAVTGLIEGLDIHGMQGVSISVTNTVQGSPRMMRIERNTINQTGGNDGIIISGGADVMADSMLVVTGNIVNTTAGDGIECVSDGVVSDNEVRGQIGIRGASYCTIDGNQVTSTSGSGISVSGCPLSVTNNILLQADDEGILCSNCGGPISDNSVRLWSSGTGNHAGIRTSTSSCATSGAVIVTNNFIEAFISGGEGINSSGVTIISNNHIEPLSGSFGIATQSGSTGSITGNVIDNGGIFVDNANEITVTGNSFIGSGTADLNITSGTQFTVTGNWIRGDLDATGSGTCALGDNVVAGTVFPGTCSASNNV